MCPQAVGPFEAAFKAVLGYCQGQRRASRRRADTIPDVVKGELITATWENRLGSVPKRIGDEILVKDVPQGSSRAQKAFVPSESKSYQSISELNGQQISRAARSMTSRDPAAAHGGSDMASRYDIHHYLFHLVS